MARWIGALLVLCTLLAACRQATVTTRTDVAAPDPTTVDPGATETPSVPPPRFVLAGLAAEVGTTASAVVAVSDVAPPVRVTLGPDAPADVSIEGDRLLFSPTEADERSIPVIATDSLGNASETTLVVRSRYPVREAIVALGDSVAAGHGLDTGDYLGDDPCWRDDDAYPVVAFRQLVNDGTLTRESALALVACSGYRVSDLWNREVTGGFADLVTEGETRSQLDWATRSNPRFITVTVGANDTGFIDPWQLFLDDGTTLDSDEIDTRLATIRDDLTIALDRLVRSTDSSIFVTGYYNPTAIDPHGSPQCPGECFVERSTEVIARLNATIETVTAAFPPERVAFVDIARRFVGHGAPNGLGPDELRESGFGILGEVFGIEQLGDIHPYCAATAPAAGESWINPIDCVHPDAQGAREIGDEVAAAIAAHVAAFPDN